MNFDGMKLKPETPKIGVGVIIRRSWNGKILLGLRKNSHGAGQWSLPGGHMEIGESFLDVCRREVREETGIEVQGIAQVGFTNDIFYEDGLHYVTLFFAATDYIGTPDNKEPDKTDCWKWFDENNLPQNTWFPLVKLLASRI